MVSVSKHNLRLFQSEEYNEEMIEVEVGSEVNILDDVKRFMKGNSLRHLRNTIKVKEVTDRFMTIWSMYPKVKRMMWLRR